MITPAEFARMLTTEVPLDGAVVRVDTEMTEIADGSWVPMSTRSLLTDDGPQLMEYSASSLFFDSVDRHHQWACDPQGCARTTARYKRWLRDHATSSREGE